jgi:palmitoyltransferase
MAWNVFKFCTGLKVIGSVMIVVVLAVVGVSYYAVIIFNYAPHLIKGGSEAAIALIVVILFHVLVPRAGGALSHTHTQQLMSVV